MKYPEEDENCDSDRGGTRDWAKDSGGVGRGRIPAVADGYAGLYGDAGGGEGGWG